MKRLLLGAIALVLACAASATTLNPVQLLNPAGSTSGQAIVSTGASTAPAWGNVPVANVTGAAPLASPAFTGTVGITNSATSGYSFTIAATSDTTQGAAILLTGNGVTTPSKSVRVAGGVLQVINNANTTAILSLDDTGDLSTTGTITGTAGSFTSLSASGNDALLYETTNAQSISSATATTVTTWTKVNDRLNTNFNASTGVYTAPVTGFYQVSAGLGYAANTGAIGTSGQVGILANGVLQVSGFFLRGATTNMGMICNVSATVALTAGQTITIQATQNTGSAVALNGVGTTNFVSINRVP